MVLGKLGDGLKSALKKVASAVFVDNKLIEELIKDLQRTLLESDVDVELVFELSEKIKAESKQDPPAGISKKEQLVKIVHDELANLLGKEVKETQIKNKPHKIMFVGLYGTGKTTSISKLGLYYSKRGYKVALIGLDVHRPAAPDQLSQLGKKIKVPVFIEKSEKNAIKIYENYKSELEKFDIVLVDTAGRHALDEELEKEIRELTKKINPQEIILTLSADIGQGARKVVEGFNKNCNITGVFLTRLDGTGKAGGALAASSITKSPIRFIGVGEKPQDIEKFEATSFISRLLGMGDLESLIEKTKLAFDEEDKENLEKRLSEGKFTLIDLYEQINAMSKMGPLNKIAELIPGMGQIKMPKDLLQVQEGKLKRWHLAMKSMTENELENPDIIDTSRITRVSQGSLVPTGEIRELLKQYKMVKKFFGVTKGGEMNPKDLQKLARKFKMGM